MRPHPRPLSLLPRLAAMAVLLLTGCATFSPDGGMESVSAMTQARAGYPLQRAGTATDSDTNSATMRTAIAQLVSQPLSAGSAVQIALMNNRGLQASLAELGVAEADLVQAGRMRNPGLHFARLRGADDVEIERGITFDLVGLLTLPVRQGIERGRFEQAKLLAASQAVQLAADTRKAYFQAVAARQTAQYMEQVGIAAEAGAELGARMAKVGNWSKLDQAREQAFHAEAVAQIARARHAATAAREQLTRLLGLWGEQAAYHLPERLPDLPPAADEMHDMEVQAMRQRLDIQIAKRDAEATAKALGLSKASGFVNVLDAGYINKSETDKPRANGYEVSLELPLFDWGGARNAKAEALYMQALHRTADTAIRARSAVREAYSGYRSSYDLARHYRDEIVPLRKTISDEVLLRYNGMLTGVFELLADAREQVVSVNAAIEAQRDFWIADTELRTAINGSGGATPFTPGKPVAEAKQEH